MVLPCLCKLTDGCATDGARGYKEEFGASGLLSEIANGKSIITVVEIFESIGSNEIQAFIPESWSVFHPDGSSDIKTFSSSSLDSSKG